MSAISVVADFMMHMNIYEYIIIYKKIESLGD